MAKKNTAQQNILIMVMSIISIAFLISIVSYLVVPHKVEDVIITPQAQELINTAKKITTPQNPEVTAMEDEIIESAVLGADCKIVITTNYNEIILNTSLSGEGAEQGCADRTGVYGDISNSGKYYAYDDISGGIDSTFKLYMLDYNKEVLLGSWGTSEIQYYAFLPDDILVSLSGYPDLYDEQYLSVFDVPKLKTEYYKNFDDKGTLKVSNLSYEVMVTLPNTGQTYRYIGYDEDTGYIKALNINEAVLVQYTLEQLKLNNSILNITPLQAKAIAFYEHTDRTDATDVYVLPNWEKTTDKAWAIDVSTLSTEKYLKTYFVDAKTGKVN